jgi:hypothetical protein
MGIFDRGGKKPQDKQPAAAAEDSDYYDSPSENVSLNAPAPQAAAPQKAAARVIEEEPRPHYGIQNAIELMRGLPVDQANVELVVAVIKGTLESLKVKVSDIIVDASARQKDLEGRVANLKQQIADFEKEISTRKEEIARLDADHAETTDVKSKLELAEKAQKASAKPAAAKPVTGASQPAVGSKA